MDNESEGVYVRAVMENLSTHQSCTGQALGPQAPRTEGTGLVRSPS